MEILSTLWTLWFGAIIWVLIKHLLEKSTIASERIYQYQKDELLRYREIAERVIEKLLLLEWHRDLFRIYLQLSYDAFKKTWAQFIDLNDSLDKSDFERNKEQIAAIIFLYFQELSTDWNECLDGISNIATIIYKIKLSNHQFNENDWKVAIDEFNKLNQSLWDKPLQISKRIKEGFLKKERLLAK